MKISSISSEVSSTNREFGFPSKHETIGSNDLNANNNKQYAITTALYLYRWLLDGQALSIPTEQDTVDVQDENKAAKRIQYRKRQGDLNGKQYFVFAISNASDQQIEKVKTRWQAYFQ